MTDHANELRRHARKIGHPAGDVPAVMAAAADWIEHLQAKSEAAEKERDELRAKIEQMERQEPVAEIVSFGGPDLKEVAWKKGKMSALGSKLYDLPGAQPAPSVPDGWKLVPIEQTPTAVAYLDLGVGGYMDIGTDLTDEELATLPKGRHMLGIIGTYGVDGYVELLELIDALEGK